MAIVMDRRAQLLKRNGTDFQGEMVARKGTLAVGFRWPRVEAAANSYMVLLRYQVE